MDHSVKTVNYKDSGVDVRASDAFVEHIKSTTNNQVKPGVLGGIGGFGAFFELPWAEYKAPVLVSGTDGCGTKLRVAIETGRHDTIGIDLVAMCANDVVTSGAKPLFFLDYYAVGQLDLSVSQSVISGIQEGCSMANMALVGGETAEMPGMYQEGDYDLAGFCVGVVEKERIIDGSEVQPGDVVIALASSGVHANGFSLVRHVLNQAGVVWSDPVEGDSSMSWGEFLLTPTRIYVESVLQLCDKLPPKAIAHITGGGIAGNLVRVLPAGMAVDVDLSSWDRPAVFHHLSRLGPVSEATLQDTFNLGVGMMVVLPSEQVNDALSLLAALGEDAWVCGSVVVGDQKEPTVRLGHA